MWELDPNEGWALKNWCFWTVELEKTLESALDSKEIKPVNWKEINPEYSLEGLMLKLKLQYFGHLMQRADSLEKTLMLGKTEGRRRRGVTEDEMVGLHHWLNGHEFEQTPGDSEAQGSLVCCSSWGHSWTTLSDWATRQRSETGEEGHPGWANSVLCETWVPMGPSDQGCYPVKELGNWALYPPTAKTSVLAFLAGMCRLRSAFSPRELQTFAGTHLHAEKWTLGNNRVCQGLPGAL